MSKPGKEGEQPEREIKYKTYKEVRKLTLTLDKAIHDLNLAPELEEVEGFKLRLLGIFSKNRSEWLEVDATSMLRGYCLVPM